MEPNTPAETQQPWPAFCEYRSALLDPFAPVNSCLFQEKREAGRLYAEPAIQPRMFWNILCHQSACAWPHVPFERTFNLLKRKKLDPALYAAQNGKHFEPPAKGGHKSAMALRAKKPQCVAGSPPETIRRTMPQSEPCGACAAIAGAGKPPCGFLTPAKDGRTSAVALRAKKPQCVAGSPPENIRRTMP